MLNLKIKEKVMVKINGIVRTVTKVINNEAGNGIIAGIVVSAIILIALILLNEPIRTFISGIWDLFSSFIEGELSTLFSS